MSRKNHPPSLASQFDLAASRLAGGDWKELSEARILLTGGTGFVGKWLLGTLLAAIQQHGLRVTVCVLTRDANRFAADHPDLAKAPQVELVTGEIEKVGTVLAGRTFTHIVHAATDASAKLNREDPLRMIDTVVGGTRELLRLLQLHPPRRFLFVSSGAVYGRQPPIVDALDEDWTGGPDPLGPGNAYHEAKRMAEQMCAAAARTQGIGHLTVARLFAFVGPYLPLDTHFAIGNFIRDAMAGQTITLTGDGSTVRSYLYASDMAAWAWGALLRGQPLRAYNIGSSSAISTRDLAHLVARLINPAVAVDIRGTPLPNQSIDRYVPATARANSELGMAEWTPLDEAIRSTITYHRNP